MKTTELIPSKKLVILKEKEHKISQTQFIFDGQYCNLSRFNTSLSTLIILCFKMCSKTLKIIEVNLIN